MERKKKLKKNQSSHLNIELASDLFLQFKGFRGFFPSYLIGLKPNTFLIIKTPTIISNEAVLQQGTSLTVRYSYFGDIFKFKSVVLGSNEKPFKVTYLSYPDVIDKIEYRDTRRVNCIIPASLVYGKAEIKGLLTDISLGGCKFRSDSIDQVEGFFLKKDVDVTLHFPLLGLEGTKEYNGKIKKLEFDNSFSLGVGFGDIEKESRDIIASYVDRTIEYRDINH